MCLVHKAESGEQRSRVAPWGTRLTGMVKHHWNWRQRERDVITRIAFEGLFLLMEGDFKKARGLGE